jgi:predicted aminopeptidase
MLKSRYGYFVATLICIASLQGCSPFYVFDAAIEQVSILSKRQDISEALTDPDVPQEVKDKLSFVQRARVFAKDSLLLTPDGSFTSYVDIQRDQLSWIVMAVKKDSFELQSWWFPIVGTVPYKGFFKKEDAEAYAKELESDGFFETWVRSTDAYSTLGWFDDPILSTTLRHPVTSIVETVLHESFHQTVWFKGEAAFNETAANLVGLAGAALFFQSIQPGSDYEKSSKQRLLDATSVGAIVNELYSKLQELYVSPKTREQKILERDQLFNEIMMPWRKKFPQMKSFAKLNNAEILQLKTYFTDFDILMKRFEEAGSLPAFIQYLTKLKTTAEEKEISPNEIYRLPLTDSASK